MECTQGHRYLQSLSNVLFLKLGGVYTVLCFLRIYYLYIYLSTYYLLPTYLSTHITYIFMYTIDYFRRKKMTRNLPANRKKIKENAEKRTGTQAPTCEKPSMCVGTFEECHLTQVRLEKSFRVN